MVCVTTITKSGMEVRSATVDNTPEECVSRLTNNIELAKKSGIEPDCYFEVFSDEYETLFARVMPSGNVFGA